jgi:CheY-like chemotaxis protein
LCDNAIGNSAPESRRECDRGFGGYPQGLKAIATATIDLFRNDDCTKDREGLLTKKRSLVSVVDDDESVRESLPDLLVELGYEARAFCSAEDFLASDCLCNTECLLLDVAMQGMSGPDLQRELKLCGSKIPIIFITARVDEAIRQSLLKQGAVECLFKPFNDAALAEALVTAIK